MMYLKKILDLIKIIMKKNDYNSLGWKNVSNKKNKKSFIASIISEKIINELLINDKSLN